MPLLSRLPANVGGDLLTKIMDEFLREGDQSRFGLANAVTAVARDTSDPDMRWNLEEFGGGIAISAGPRQPADGAMQRRHHRVKQLESGKTELRVRSNRSCC